MQRDELGEFFKWAYSPRVLDFLIRARAHLRWRDRRVDRTLMALVLIYLHGRRGAALSNQLRDSKAMAPAYAVRWWKERGLEPPDIDPIALLESRMEWRYARGIPKLPGAVHLGDSLKLLRSRQQRRGLDQPFDLLFTSPPYMGVTNYHYDQWLRLWMLGWPPGPAAAEGRWQKRFESREDYATLLHEGFGAAAEHMSDESVVYVRTDARSFTLEATVAALTDAFPEKALHTQARPAPAQSQTSLFGDLSTKPGEVDLVMTPN
jgi:hypothetical protein